MLIIAFTCSANAQLFTKERLINNVNYIDNTFLTWGYYIGFNNYDLKFEYNNDLQDIEVTNTFGFQVGLVGDMRINKHINLRLEPGVFFTNRNLVYGPDYFGGGPVSETDSERVLKSTFFHVPLLVKFSTKRLNNFKPFVIGGVSTSINLGANEDSLEDNSSGQFRMTRNNFYYEIGFGIDFYTQYFRFTPSIRGVFAINDELVRDEDPASPWTSNIQSMKTRGVFISFSFQ